MASPFENADTTHSTPQSIPSPKGATAHDDLDKQQSALGTTNSVHVNADLYRTLSPTDVAMWDLKGELFSPAADRPGVAWGQRKVTVHPHQHPPRAPIPHPCERRRVGPEQQEWQWPVKIRERILW